MFATGFGRNAERDDDLLLGAIDRKVGLIEAMARCISHGLAATLCDSARTAIVFGTKLANRQKWRFGGRHSKDRQAGTCMANFRIITNPRIALSLAAL